MLVQDQAVVRAELNVALSEPLRYLPPRIAELMDCATHFSLSGHPRFGPLPAVRELALVAAGFLGKDGTRREAMQSAAGRTGQIIKRTRKLHAWMPAERAAALEALAAIAQPPLNSKRGASAVQQESSITNAVKKATGSAIRGPLSTFKEALEDPMTGYRARLLGEIASAVSAELTDEQWRDFDDDLADLAGLLLAEGRGGVTFVRHLANAFLGARTDAEALTALQTMSTAAPRDFYVAFALRGAQPVENARTFSCVTVKLVQADWPEHSGTTKANNRLRAHLRASIPEGTRGCGVITAVTAFDAEHARSQAIGTVEELHDHVTAEHRVHDFELVHGAITLDIAAGRIEVVGRGRRSTNRARTLMNAPDPVLREALRFHALARREQAPAVRTLHGWICLEKLAFGGESKHKDGKWRPQSPSGFVPPHAGATMRLASVRQLLASAWHLARARSTHYDCRDEWQEIERWANQPQNQRLSLARWQCLVEADASRAVPPGQLSVATSPSDAAAWMDLFAEQLGVYTARRVKLARWLFADGQRMSNYATGVAQRAEIHAARMNWSRNKTVHNAMTTAPSAAQLARSTVDLTDCVFETVPYWMTNRLPWQALRDIRERSAQIDRDWRNGVHVPTRSLTYP